MSGFRTVVIESPCKVTYKDGFMVVRGDDLRLVHLSELHTLILDTTMVTVTGYLLCELVKAKVNLVFCDEKRQPAGQIMPFYGSHDSAGRVAEQAVWPEKRKAFLWQQIIRQKIIHQATLLKKVDPTAAAQIASFATSVEPGDPTNREGHAAKMYFRRIFGPGFQRDIKSDRNAALNYGYSLLLSSFNKEIVSRGYTTQLGIHHRNMYNHFNLGSDLMESFRYLIDRMVLEKGDICFDKSYKYALLELLGLPVRYGGQEVVMTTAIARTVRNATEYLGGRIDWTEDMLFHGEDADNAADCDV